MGKAADCEGGHLDEVADDERPPPGRVTACRSQKDANPYRDETFLAMDDFLFAALFLWMTPLLTALSSLVEATLSASAAAETSPDAAAVLNLRIQVRISLLTALLRSVALAFVLMRLSWDLMFATRNLSHIRVGQ